MNCLVLGGGGFLGSHLSESLLSHGHRVRIFEQPGFSQINLAGIVGRVETVEGSLDRASDASAVLEGIEIVFHLASTTVPASSNTDPFHDVASNVLPTLRLLDAAKEARLRKFVFFSSGGTVYGIPERIPLDETHPTNPISAYGIHKLAIEKYLYLYSHLFGVPSCVLRISNAYGERQSPTSGQGAIAAFLFRALRREPIEIWGDGSVVRDYIHVSDVLEAAIAAIGYEGRDNVFNIGSGTGTSLREVVRAVLHAVGWEVEVRYLPSRALDVPANVLAISRARRELGWSPKVTLVEGIGRTLSHARSENRGLRAGSPNRDA